MSDDETFEVTDAGSSMCEKTDTNRLKNGSLIMIKGFPCKVRSLKSPLPNQESMDPPRLL